MHNIDVFDRLCKSIRDRRSIIKGKFLDFGSDIGKRGPEPEAGKESADKKEDRPRDMPAGDKDSVVEEFQKLESVDLRKANALFDAGFTSVAALKNAKSYELVGAKGITPTIANKIVKQVKEL
jgi:hypothetical protein